MIKELFNKLTKRSADTTIQPRYPRLPSQPIEVTTNMQAMRLSAAYRCSDILSGTIASLPLTVKFKKNGYYSVDESNSLFDLLQNQPNGRMNAYELIRNAIWQMINNGNAYIVINRKFDEVSSLVLCSNSSVFYDKYSDTYAINDTVNHIHGRYVADDIIHLRNMSLDGGYTGVSTIFYGAQILSIAASADNQSLKTFQNGTKIKGIISGAKEVSRGLQGLNEKQTQTIAERVEDEFNNGHDIASIESDAKFTQLSINPVDAQLLETKKFSVLDICRFYGVHPDKVFAQQNANYKASEMSSIMFLTDTLQPILRRVEAELNYKLIPRSVRNYYKIAFDLAAIYQTDLTTQSTYYKTMEELGVMTPNDIRREKGLTPIEGGDDVLISCNVQTLQAAKEKNQQQPPKTE